MSTAKVTSLKPAKTVSDIALEIGIDLMERGLVPDAVTRAGIRKLCAQRLQAYAELSASDLQEAEQKYVAELCRSPIAVHTQDANRQHYELPAEFFDLVLGRNKKYSSAFWDSRTTNLDDAEDNALNVTIARAGLSDGMSILELGCGWGSLSLAMAKRFRNSKIVALSNSNSQREFIDAQARQHGLTNLTVITRDISETKDLQLEFGHFDRVVSVEMFEHVRNYRELFQRISSWLKPEGKLFAHIFTHREHSYHFETEGEDNWMGKYFFTGGQMPSRYLFRSFQRDLTLEKQWSWNGSHYAKTCEAWLRKMDAEPAQVMKIMKATYGDAEAARWVQRWRVFFLSCAELFAFRDGNEWFVSHYLFSRKGDGA
jgi:cyclopropane-fatty-acyl-phospholipid synthase